uniref:Uncharacterized protein n=1 Tax=Avena sativa TaxID=4498 RepID=A0ACD5V584_AVESA
MHYYGQDYTLAGESSILILLSDRASILFSSRSSHSLSAPKPRTSSNKPSSFSSASSCCRLSPSLALWFRGNVGGKGRQIEATVGICLSYWVGVDLPHESPLALTKLLGDGEQYNPIQVTGRGLKARSDRMAASVTTGVLSPLLAKLTNLLGDEYKKLTGVRKQASFLRDELRAIKALLDKMELMDKLDPSVKNWRDHIREMSYDMENCIDDFMRDIEAAPAKVGFVRKMAQRLRRLGRRHHIANRIEELKFLAVEANARRERYRIDDCINSSHRVVGVDPRISAIYKEAVGLVGIDGPREELVNLLTDSQKKLKVVSIVGFRGLGKTTLAKQVYDEIGGEYTCKAFVSVSQRPDVKSLLIGLQLKLGMEESSHAHELQDIIDCLREHLKHKRYFVLVDDLWDQSTWNIIRCAFPENSNESRVMVTTRLDDIALWVCHNESACIYKMKCLEEEYSRRLFFNRVFGPENVCPPHFEEISAQILKKCGGLPLAIITIASLLASHEARSLSKWESIMSSLGAKVGTKPTMEEMRGILNLSYVHLPVHLRPCFLYLGMYPEDHDIDKDGLVRQWIAEGFVCSFHGVDLDDVAKTYFNELINRSLIQPERTYYGEVLSCRVHDMMHDLILSKSTEDNFISVAYNYEDMARLHSCEYKVRRLSLNSSAGSATSETLATSMSQVRSYARFGESTYTIPLSQFKYLRVLLFEFPNQWYRTVDLTALGHLYLLRYLKVLARFVVVVLPREIQGLVHLETLELDCESMQSFPSDISRLAKLCHLILPYGSAMPEGIQNLKSLRTLHCLGMSESSLEDMKGLSKLINLKQLTLGTLYSHRLTVEEVDAFVSSIGMLQDLKQLSLDCWHECNDYGCQLDSLPNPPARLEILNLETWRFSSVPRWIGELRYLRILNLLVLQMSTDEIRVLGELPSLVAAWFRVLDASQDKIMVVGTGLFPVLESILFRSDQDVSAYLSFETGAMPKLQTLNLRFGWKEWRGATPVGMECLPCLQDIHVWLVDTGVESSKNPAHVLGAVESAFRSAAQVHPRHPSVTVDY